MTIKTSPVLASSFAMLPLFNFWHCLPVADRSHDHHIFSDCGWCPVCVEHLAVTSQSKDYLLLAQESWRYTARCASEASHHVWRSFIRTGRPACSLRRTGVAAEFDYCFPSVYGSCHMKSGPNLTVGVCYYQMKETHVIVCVGSGFIGMYSAVMKLVTLHELAFTWRYIHGGPKSKPLPNYQQTVFNRIKVCQWD